MPGVIISALSDTHGMHREVVVLPCDILIHCGDISQFDDGSHYKDFVQWFSEQPAIHKIFIGGNHDEHLEEHGRDSPYLAPYPDVIYLDGSGAEIMGLKIWGSAVQPRTFDMAFTRNRTQLKEAWDKAPSDADIIVSHCPPYGILDRNVNGEHAGCDVLLRAIKRVGPRLNLFGHIHEAYGVTSKTFDGKTSVFANCSSVNRQRKVANAPWRFQIKDGNVLVG